MFEPKIRVTVLGENGVKSRKQYKIKEGNTVLIEKGKQGRGKVEYRPKFDKSCLVHRDFRPFPWLFTRHSVELFLIYGAEKCISFFPKTEIPRFDKKARERLTQANAIKQAGASFQKLQIPIFFWLFLLFILGLQLLQILISTGRIYI